MMKGIILIKKNIPKTRTVFPMKTPIQLQKLIALLVRFMKNLKKQQQLLEISFRDYQTMRRRRQRLDLDYTNFINIQ